MSACKNQQNNHNTLLLVYCGTQPKKDFLDTQEKNKYLKLVPVNQLYPEG